MSFLWDDAAVAELKRLYTEGLSHSQIACELGGGLTRNACIGKCQRLGLAPRKQGVSEFKRAKPSRRTHAKAMADRRTATIPAAFTAPLPEERVEAFAMTETAVGIFDLTDKHCRWPVGEACGSDQLFCGAAPEQGAYCLDHWRLSVHRREEGNATERGGNAERTAAFSRRSPPY